MLPCIPGSSCSIDAVGLLVCLPSPIESFQGGRTCVYLGLIHPVSSVLGTG